VLNPHNGVGQALGIGLHLTGRLASAGSGESGAELVGIQRPSTPVADRRLALEPYPCGVPKRTDPDSTYPWLRYSLAVIGIADDGTVTITASGKHVLVKPGGETRVERSVGLWHSTLTIQHRGFFRRDRVLQSK